MNKKELRALRRPFVRALFQHNLFNLFMTVLASVLNALCMLILSWLIKEVVDLISGSSTYSFQILLIAAGCAIVTTLLSGAIDYCFLSKFRAKAMRQYREYAFQQLTKKGIQAFSGENSALYISALSSDVYSIERDFIANLQSGVELALTFVGALALMLWYSPLLTFVAIGFSLLPIGVSLILSNKTVKAEKSVSDEKERYMGLLKDVLTGFAVIKSFKAEQSIARMHDSRNGALAAAAKNRERAVALVNYSSGLAGGILQEGVFLVAALLALSGRSITGGTAIIFLQLLSYVLTPIRVFPRYYAGAKASFALIDKLAQALSKNVLDEGGQLTPTLSDGISVQALSFSYEADKRVLHELDMAFRAGGCYALVGGSGSGKSTLLHLLMASSREYQGKICYDGKELRAVSPSSLYDLVSIIQQNVFVFNSTIRDNITMFSDFPKEEVDDAVRLSGLKKLIDEKGEDYLCGENGAGLSGGERQRISIARALLRRTPVLLVDEATAALDAETSFEVLDAILKLDGFTRVIVTHDLDENILRRCTGLYTLKNGRVSEQGSFDELMAQKGYFYSLFTVSQR